MGSSTLSLTGWKSRCQLAWTLTGTSGGDFTSRLIQVVHRIQFLVVVRQRSVSMLVVGWEPLSAPESIYISNHIAPHLPVRNTMAESFSLQISLTFPSSTSLLLPAGVSSLLLRVHGIRLGPFR